MIFFYAHRSVFIQPSFERLPLVADRTDAELHRQKLVRKRVYLGGLEQITPLRAQGVFWKRRQKDFKSQRGWRKTREQGPLNQLSKIHMSQKRLKQQAQGLNEYTGSLLEIQEAQYTELS
jgi:hypothetical protein